MKFILYLFSSMISSIRHDSMLKSNKRPRIAIIGGGLAGLTAANALLENISSKEIDIIIFEGDKNAYKETDQYCWSAAAAKNANSIVPGASMHLLAQRQTLWNVLRDSLREWSVLRFEEMQRLVNLATKPASFVPSLSIDNYEVPPPYFALHIWKCLGFNVAQEERTCFLTFVRNFLKTSLLESNDMTEKRKKVLVDLSGATQFMVTSPKSSSSTVESKRGFLSLYRSPESANAAITTGNKYGQRCELKSFDAISTLWPYISNIPIQPLYGVFRHNDLTADCLKYTQICSQNLESQGVTIIRGSGGNVTKVERCYTDDNLGRYKVSLSSGKSVETDLLVLAAGTKSPIFARQLGAGKFCPTYPLRGFSLTLDRERMNQIIIPDMDSISFSFDQMYFTCTPGKKFRIAGFGELTGFDKSAEEVPSVAPRVILRYARTLFPSLSRDLEERHVRQCFRPLSPDDLPIVGKISSYGNKYDGLYFHTGHGSLGWTLCFSTAYCLACMIKEDLGLASQEGNIEDRDVITLPNGSKVQRGLISPDRFL